MNQTSVVRRTFWLTDLLNFASLYCPIDVTRVKEDDVIIVFDVIASDRQAECTVKQISSGL